MHSIMCFHSVRSACWQSHQCNQCRSTNQCRPSPQLRFQKPQFKVCSTCITELTSKKNHCAFHPSAITIAVSACAFQSVQSTHRQSTVAISACVSNIRVSNHSSLCVPPATIRTRAFYFYTSERKSFMQSTQSPT